MRTKYVIGNWKMNLNFKEASLLVSELDKIQLTQDVKMVICPSFTYLHPLINQLNQSEIMVGAQNCAENEKGAFTGEVSSSMLQSIDVRFVIIGHSERRALFGDINEKIKNKIVQALNSQLRVIFCCGETLPERESGNYRDVIKHQLNSALQGINESQMKSIIIAYEPVWAIGTGKTASPEQAQEVHLFIRQELATLYGTDCAASTSILYGGSCNAENAKDLFQQPDIDGGLIGGASLKSHDFERIYQSF